MKKKEESPSRLIKGNGKYPWVERMGDKLSEILVKEEDGIPAQNNPNPVSDFDWHQILEVHIDGTKKYFDPSYGEAYQNLSEMQEKSLAGFGVFSQDRIPIKTKDGRDLTVYEFYLRKVDSNVQQIKFTNE